QTQIQVDSSDMIQSDTEDEVVNLLEVLTDCKTHWNSTYLAWKRILSLHLAILILVTTLRNKSDAVSK
ncbi:1590_t:CDS:1, partial [Racocetra persica]